MFESARKNANARKHHLIPRSYLVRWEKRGSIRVTESDTRNSYCSSPEKTAREKDFYSLASDDLDPHAIPPVLIETILSRVEGAAKSLIDVLISDGPAALDEWDAISFASFLSFQTTRGRAFRARLMALANAGELLIWGGVTDEVIGERLRTQGADGGPEAVATIRSFVEDWRAGRYIVGPQPAAQVGYAAMAAEHVGMYFLARPFRVYRSIMPLITCDEPVVPLPLPGHDARTEPGVSTAGAIVLPLDPHHLLVMFHPYLALDEIALCPELLPSETDEINLFIAAHSDRWMFELPDRRRTQTLLVPRRLPSARCSGPSRLPTLRTGNASSSRATRRIAGGRRPGLRRPP
jgi:hypothetical protein